MAAAVSTGAGGVFSTTRTLKGLRSLDSRPRPGAKASTSRSELTGKDKDGEPFLLTLEQARRLIDLDDERERKDAG